MMTAPALWVAFAAMLPLMLYTCWSDLRTMKIPNWIPLAVLGVYVVTGLWGLPMDRFLWGLGAGAVMLVVFFLVWALADSFFPGKLGAGDVKLLAVLVPFVDLHEAFPTLVVFTVVIVIYLFVFFGIFAFTKRRPAATSVETEGGQMRKAWKATSPFGIAMAVTAIIYLGLKTWDSLA